jgi:putative Mg2+ transporter-C (MgtC) family protein
MHPHFNAGQMQHMQFLTSSVARLLLAAVLGGAIGLERTIHHKAAGIRTNMFICMGAAMFTILSDVIPDPSVADRTRISANIVQGIGFLGAGAILHGKTSVSGMTTAAAIWMVASVGMACGAGHYLLAVFATFTLLIALNLFGYFETAVGLKAITMNYQVKGESTTGLLDRLNEVLGESHHGLQGLQIGTNQAMPSLTFRLTCTLPDHRNLQARLRMDPVFESLTTFHADPDE